MKLLHEPQLRDGGEHKFEVGTDRVTLHLRNETSQPHAKTRPGLLPIQSHKNPIDEDVILMSNRSTSNNNVSASTEFRHGIVSSRA